MADLATLGINIKYESAKAAGNALDELASKGAKAQQSTDRLTSSTNAASSSFSMLKTALAGIALGKIASDAIKTADAYTAMQSQLKLVTETTRELIYVQEQLNDVANNTYSSMKDNAKLFAAIEPAVKQLGMTTDETIRFTQTFNKALALTAPTASESASAIQQFLQAMGTGVLRGEEFNSIMENGRGVAQALADGLKVPIGELRKMAEAGELTSSVVIGALESQRQAIDTKFGKMQMTVSQSSQVMANEWMMFIGAVDKSIDGTAFLSNAIKSLAEDLGSVTSFIADYGNASRAADIAVKSVAASASMFADSISTGDLLRSISGEIYDLGLAFSALGSDLALAYRVITDITNTSQHWDQYKNEIADLETKSAAFKKGMDEVKKSADEQAKSIKQLGITSSEYSTQAGQLLEQESGFGTQREMLIAQQKTFGDGLMDVTRIMTTYGVETNTAMQFSDKGRGIIAKLQEEYAMLGMSVRDAAIAKAVFAAQGQGATDDEIKYIREQTAKNYDLVESIKLKIKLTDANKNALEKANKAHLDYIKTAQNQAFDDFADDIKRGEEYTKRQSDALEALQDELNPTIALYKKYGQQVLLLDEAYRQGNLSTADHTALIVAAQKQLGEGLESQRKKTDDEYSLMVKAAENSLKRLDDAFANTWKDIFDGSKDFGQSLKSWFNSLLAELAHAAITKPIVISMTSALGLGGTTSALASSGSIGGFNALSSIGSMYSGAVTALGSAATYGGSLLAGAGSAQASMLAAQSGAFGLEGAALTTGALTGGTMGSVMSTLSTAMPYVAAFFALDSMLGGKITSGIATGITGGSYELKSVTAKLSALGDTIDASIIQIERKDGGWFNKSKSRKKDLATNDLDVAMQTAYNDLYSNVSSLAKKLGFAVAENFTASVKMSVKGKTSEEIQAIFNDMFVNIGNKLVSSANGLSDALSPLQKSGEQTFETLSRVVGQFELFNYPVGRLNDSLSSLTVSTVKAVDSLVAMTGGIQNLQALQSNFIQAFYTDEQKFEITTKSVNGLFESLGQSLPSSEQGLIDLVKGLDLTTESGQQAYVAITSASASLNDFYETMKDQAEEAANLAKQQAEDAKSTVATLFGSFSTKSQSIQIQLLELTGDKQAILNIQRQEELDAMDESLRQFQERLWALQDEKSILDKIAESRNKYNATLTSAKDFLSGVSTSIKAFIASLVIGSSSMSYASTLALAQSGDRDALSNITQSAQSYLDDQRSKASTLEQYNVVKAGVANQLSKLPEQVSPEKYLAQEIQKSFDSQTLSLRDKLSELPTGLQAVVESASYEIDAVIDFATTDTGIDANLRYLLLQTTTDIERTIELTANTDSLTDAQKKFLLNDTFSVAAQISAMLDDGVVSDSEALKIVEMSGHVNDIETVLKVAGGVLTTDQKTALTATTSTIQKTLEAKGGTLTASQQSILAAVNGTTTATLDANVAIQSQDLTDMLGDTGTIADRAKEQLTELGVLNASMLDQVNALGALNTTMGSLSQNIQKLTWLNEKLSLKSDIEAEAKSIYDEMVAALGSNLTMMKSAESFTSREAFNDYVSSGNSFTMLPANGYDAATNASGKYSLSNYTFMYDNATELAAYNAIEDKGRLGDLKTKYNMLVDSMPQFAVGTNFVPNDMVAQIHKGEMIVPAKFNPATSGLDNSAMVEELRALRAELAELKQQDRQVAVQLIKQAQKQSDFMDKWDATGLKTEVIV